MSKTLPEIAKAILERRSRMTHIILPGEISAAIGPDGVSEALRQRWLMPDTDSGYLCVSSDPAIIEALHKTAEMKPKQYAPDGVSVSEGHDFSLLHTHRSHAIHEIAAPMTGQPSPGLSTLSQPPQTPQAPQAPQAPQSQASSGQGGYTIGMPVTVARQGLKSTGVIEKLMPDGRFQVGFAADQKKPQGDNIFSATEVSVVPNTPQRPSGSSVSTGTP